ncbi:hypothetical protein SOPP22_09525 [Shewanella sp. OPT22]|nr:hypothetical protein SOPP22_09525 [Shewanella sp. OPT22]
MTSGKLYQSHVDLFPIDKDDPEALAKRRESFVNRATQVFDDETTINEVRESIPLEYLFDLWTELKVENFWEMRLWYLNWRHFLKYQDRLAVVFFGTFTLETLNINLKFGNQVKEHVEVVWEAHTEYIDKCKPEDVKVFIERVKLMCESPLLPTLLKDIDDVALRKTAYMHYGDLYGVPENDKALLESYAEQYAKVIVADEIEEIKSLMSKRSSTKELDAMWKDIIETFNLSRRFHASVFGSEVVRPIIPLK